MSAADVNTNLERFTRYWLGAESTVQAYVRLSVRNHADAAEVVQEAALRMARGFESFDHDKPFLPWALRITRSAIVDFLRKSGRRGPVLSTETIGELSETFERLDPEVRAMRGKVEECIDRLPERWGVIVRLRYAHDASPMHIAVTMGTTPEAIRSALVRIRRKLAECLGFPFRAVAGGTA